MSIHKRKTAIREYMRRLLKQLTYARLRIIFLAAAIGFSGTVLFIFIGSRQHGNGQAPAEAPVPEGSGLNIGRIKHTATRNGVTEWQLVAESVEYITDGNRAVLTDLEVTFFLKNNDTTFLKAEKGILDTAAFDIDVSGNVEMKNAGYRLLADHLSYRHERRLVFSETPVTLEGNGFYLRSDSIEIDLAANQTRLKGHVKGSFDENNG